MSKWSSKVVFGGQTQKIPNTIIHLFHGMFSTLSYWHRGELVLSILSGTKNEHDFGLKFQFMHLLFKSTMLILLSEICLDNLSDQCLTLKTVSFVFLNNRNKKNVIYLTLDLESKATTAYSESKEGLWNTV